MQAEAKVEVDLLKLLQSRASRWQRPVRQILRPRRVRLEKRGPFRSSRRLQGAKLEGKRYERKFGIHLLKKLQRERAHLQALAGQKFREGPEAAGEVQASGLCEGPGVQEIILLRGQWFTYWDETGQRWAQADQILVTPWKVVVFECKLTQSDMARAQLAGYGRLVQEVWPTLEVVLVEVFKNLVAPIPRKREVGSLAQVLQRDPAEDPYLWHWLGR